MIGKLMPQYGFIAWRRKKTNLIGDKRKARCRSKGTHPSVPKKSHPTGKFVIVA